MQAEAWDPSVHVPMVTGWIRARELGEDAGDVALLPPTGLVVGGIAAGFVYMTNGGVAFIDSFMTDPASSKADRSEALDTLMVLLVAQAKELGYAVVIGTTTAQPLADRFHQHGFSVSDGFYVVRRV